MEQMEQLIDIFYNNIISAQSSADLKALTRRTHMALDEVYKNQLLQTNSKIFCEEGCSYCCYFLVDVTPGDIFCIGDYVRKHYAPSDINRLIENTSKVSQLIAPMTLQECQSTPIECPLLKNSRCSVYPSRPSFCRVYHSTDINVCEAFLDKDHKQKLHLELQTVPEVDSQTQLSIVALQAAYERAGYDCRLYDLSSALYELLTTKDKETCWLRKEYVFSHRAVAKSYIASRGAQ